MDPVTILSSLLPLVTEGGKALINKFFGEPKESFRPANVDQAVKLYHAENEKLKTLYSLGNSGETYKWVEAVKQLQRPLVIVGILGTWIYMHGFGLPDTGTVDNMASAVGFYLFGDRTLFYIRKARGK